MPGLHGPVGEVAQRRADGRAQGDEQDGHRVRPPQQPGGDGVAQPRPRRARRAPSRRGTASAVPGARRDERLLDVDRVRGEGGEPAEHPDPEERSSQGWRTVEVPSTAISTPISRQPDVLTANVAHGKPVGGVRNGVLQAGPGQRADAPRRPRSWRGSSRGAWSARGGRRGRAGRRRGRYAARTALARRPAATAARWGDGLASCAQRPRELREGRRQRPPRLPATAASVAAPLADAAASGPPRQSRADLAEARRGERAQVPGGRRVPLGAVPGRVDRRVAGRPAGRAPGRRRPAPTSPTRTASSRRRTGRCVGPGPGPSAAWSAPAGCRRACGRR